jgi:hypothetical protein
MAGPSKAEIDAIIKELKEKAKLEITVEGDQADFLCVSIERKSDGTIHMSQPHLIDQILNDLCLNDDPVKMLTTPAASSKLIMRHSNSQNFDGSFDYRSVIGMSNYLEKATRSDIAYAMHQCARFVLNPKRDHGDAVRWMGRYLKFTRDKGTIYRLIVGKDLEVYVDASICGDWNPIEAMTEKKTLHAQDTVT